jgi:hypothetical protein
MFIIMKLTYLYSVVADNKNIYVTAICGYFFMILVHHNKHFPKHIIMS